MENEEKVVIEDLDAENEAITMEAVDMTEASKQTIASDAAANMETEAETLTVETQQADKNVKDSSMGDSIMTLEISQDVISSPAAITPPSSASEAAKSSAPSPRPYILSMTQDSLHSIASFLTPLDWCRFGQTNKAALKLCNETTRSVRLHGFRCAQEIVASWKLGQHEDAKELAALYIANGVPIYPSSLGHSYHTILWRMEAETKQLLQQEEVEREREQSEGVDATVRESSVDRFYRERQEFRSRENFRHCMSYLSEKCLFWMDARENKDHANRPTRLVANSLQNQATARAHQSTASRNTESIVVNATKKRDFRPKLHVKIHQHLLDQHKHNRKWINDSNGSMMTPPISLSADFFHSTNPTHQSGPLNITLPEEERPKALVSRDSFDDSISIAFLNEMQVVLDDEEADVDGLGELENILRLGPEDFLMQGLPLRQPVIPPKSIPRAQLNDVLSRVNLELYSSCWTASAKKDEPEGVQEMKRHLRSRFATYKRRLESYLVQKDLVSFDECIMDFWDEFFPHSAGVHYYDRMTVVPRISGLAKFLTKPVPKAFGIIQCEIERIVSTTGKGASMKGRFFPTYEYRLFIRHASSQPDPETAADEEPRIRRDTLLMVAKNRGRKHTEASVVSMSAAAKKGSNNYYLYMPQQSDVDTHFNIVNKLERPAMMNPNGASQLPVILSDDFYSSLLGRLQSNFIGTEFQIFTPHVSKRPRRVSYEYSSFAPCSEDELESDDGFSSDNTSTTARRPRFGRLSLRRNTSGSSLTPFVDGSLPVATDANATRAHRARSPPLKERVSRHRRSNSCPDVPYPRQVRTNRRVANNPDWKTEEKKMFILEEEDGCITYTANLLGSRPRIMDVCIPKIHPEANQCIEWKRYLEQCDDLDECKMLDCFRQMQQRLENPSQGIEEGEADGDSDAGAKSAPEDFGLMPLQNRPPWWNVELGSFVLNFGGRVSVASVKNFQLCDRNDHDQILLQFGRIQGRHSFTMDFQHPLTAVQAFSIAISSLQSKISFA
ncbi:hypothetical protein MPSEU_000092400 [Mayamaea pseudoterrestris]|nr:hypothetical protein MPSEU_000092400 [Mayamaea pseudoterrestris]